jgi:hypothetical protein
MEYSTRRHPRNVDRQWLPWSTQAALKDARRCRRRESLLRVIRVVDVSLPVRSTPRPDILCAARRTHIPIPINIELALISQLQLVYEPHRRRLERNAKINGGRCEYHNDNEHVHLCWHRLCQLPYGYANGAWRSVHLSARNRLLVSVCDGDSP